MPTEISVFLLSLQAMPLKLTTYYRGSKVPDLPGTNTFHSTELFRIYEETPGYTPILIVASEDDKPVAKLLAAIRKSVRMFPPGIIKRCEVYGTGEYFNNEADKEIIFSDMLQRLTNEALRDSFLIEFRNLENAMFGYKSFRQIKKGLKNGAQVREARTKEEILCFAQMLRHVYSSKIRRHFPSIKFFQHLENQLTKGQQSKIFIVIYKEKIIGGSACIYSDDSAYLWFSGGMRKTYALQYPGILAVWKALDDAKQRGYRHLEFMDVGLPFRKHGYRRWFRFRWNWLNRVLIKMYE